MAVRVRGSDLLTRDRQDKENSREAHTPALSHRLGPLLDDSRGVLLLDCGGKDAVPSHAGSRSVVMF